MKHTYPKTLRFHLFLSCWFCVLFLERIARQMSFTEFEFNQNFRIIAFLSSLIILLFITTNRTILLFLLACIGQIALYHGTIPGSPILSPLLLHWFMADITMGICLYSIVRSFIAQKSNNSFSEISTIATPILRGFFTITLIFIGFSKLNSSFLDANLSCSSRMFELVQKYLPLLGTISPLKPLIAWLIFLIEFTCPLLLLIPRTRNLSLLLIALLMFSLGAIPDYSLYEFAGQYFSLLILFIEPKSILIFYKKLFQIDLYLKQKYLILSKYRTEVSLLVIFLIGIWCAIAELTSQFFLMNHLCQIIWLIIFIIFLFILKINSNITKRTLSFLPPKAVIIPILFYGLLISKEATTYLGIKHYPAFMMASGLEVSKLYSNHLIIKDIPDIGINRVAKIRSSNSSHLPPGAYFSLFPLIWFVSNRSNIQAQIEVDGKVIATPLNIDSNYFAIMKILKSVSLPMQLSDKSNRCELHPQ